MSAVKTFSPGFMYDKRSVTRADCFVKTCCVTFLGYGFSRHVLADTSTLVDGSVDGTLN